MNIHKVRSVIENYIKHFEEINYHEIYKWQAVKCFQDNWNLGSPDFCKMLEASLHDAKNLMDSGQYFPKRMLLRIAHERPEELRQLFYELYDEENDYMERILNFQKGIKGLRKELFPNKNDYQDKRALLVYLTLRYPDRYYLFKFGMFKDFVSLIDFPYQPIKGRPENVTQFLFMCNLLREEVARNQELLNLHKTRISDTEYSDNEYTLLTQDIIYAAVKHLPRLDKIQKKDPAANCLFFVEGSIYSEPSEKTDSIGRFTNYIEVEREKKRIGDLGELLVLRHEQDKVQKYGINKVPEHVSKTKGDGLGYDILSYDQNEQPKFIEVKTTKGSRRSPFYITNSELECSRKNGNNFYLYRLFEFDEVQNTAKYSINIGSLEPICTDPILYRVKSK